MPDNSAEIEAIIDGPLSDEEAADALRQLGLLDPLAWEIVLANRHDGAVDNVAIDGDTSGPGWPD